MPARLALVAALALVGAIAIAFVTVRSSGEPPAALPSPTATGSAPTTSSPPTSSPPSTSPTSASPRPNVELALHVVRLPRDFRYVPTSSRLLLLDIAGGNAIEVASFSVSQPEPGYPIAEVAASQDGKSVLLAVYAGQRDGTAFLLTPENGQSRVLLRGAVVRTALSADGSRFAVARKDEDPALTGLWVGATSGGPMRRLIADDPHYAGAPPVPYGFSPGAEFLAFGLFNGESGAHAGIVSVSSTEGRADRSSGTWAIRGSDAVLLGPSAGAEFISNDELFVWSWLTPLGGETLAYTYKIATKTRKDLYRGESGVTIADASWALGARRFAVAERPICCGVALDLTVRTIAEDGSSRTLGQWTVIDMWWSGTGTSASLYGILGGDDSASAVVEMLTNKTAMRFCWRGGSPGSCT